MFQVTIWENGASEVLHPSAASGFRIIPIQAGFQSKYSEKVNSGRKDVVNLDEFRAASLVQADRQYSILIIPFKTIFV